MRVPSDNPEGHVLPGGRGLDTKILRPHGGIGAGGGVGLVAAVVGAALEADCVGVGVVV